MVHFKCERCQNTLFFENTSCLKCESLVGFEPASRRMVTLGMGDGFKLCKNGRDYKVCNWVLPEDCTDEFCVSCQLNRTVPDLSIEENVINWGKMEVAKRRTLYTLSEVGLRPPSKAKEEDGLAFEFLNPTPDKPVSTGHDEGVIIINLQEADDSFREKMRKNLGEPYRTLVGHFRHEIGHYYWDQLLKARDENDPIFKQWRELFGDENESYADAMKRHYEQGPPKDWALTYISSYATMHPWEDWAETWAQYLHILDGIETVRDFGWNSAEVPIPFTPFTAQAIGIEEDETDQRFLDLVNAWARLAPALNEIALSLGQGNLYPFVFTAEAVRKISFVHTVVKHGIPGKAKRKVSIPEVPATKAA